MKIKVCGLRDAENIEAVAALKPDYVGFIRYNKSPRYAPDLPLDVLKSLPLAIKKTGVFVDEDRSAIEFLINYYQLNAVQLHGHESADFCAAFKGRVTVLKAFGLHDDFDFEQLKAYANNVDFFLFDTKTTGYGGSGKTFNWAILNKYRLDVPFFLSGGINLDNLEEISNISNPQFYGVDLNSGFETAPGVKNIEKLKQAFDIIKKINN